MCKALSHAIRIVDVRLRSKRGGRRNVGPDARQPRARRTRP
jgi:molybdenum cofactor biosynthesis enzyme